MGLKNFKKPLISYRVIFSCSSKRWVSRSWKSLFSLFCSKSFLKHLHYSPIVQKLVSALGPDSQNNSAKHVRIAHLACRTFFVCVRLKNAKISHVSMQQAKNAPCFTITLSNATTSSSGTINIWLTSWQTPWIFIVVTYILQKGKGTT